MPLLVSAVFFSYVGSEREKSISDVGIYGIRNNLATPFSYIICNNMHRPCQIKNNALQNENNNENNWMVSAHGLMNCSNKGHTVSEGFK